MSEDRAAAADPGQSGPGVWTGRACDFAGALLAAMALLIGAEILLRGVSGKSTLIADEYSGYLFVWITMIGFSHALQIGSFLRVESFVSRFGPRGQAASELLAATAGFFVSVVCIYATGKLVLASWTFGTVSIQPSTTPLWIPQLVLPLGFVALAVLYLGLLLKSWRRLRSRA
jgi:TRAP-type transport system small permease protein